MSCCKKPDVHSKPSCQTKCEKLALDIQNQEVRQYHIVETLKKLIQTEKKMNKNRFLGEPSYSFAKYLSGNNINTKGVSLLHLAVSCDRDEVALMLNDEAPNLSKTARTDDEGFRGQTPFHIAVAKSKYDLVNEMLSKDKEDGSMELLTAKARGSSLKGTIMMGETPLSIAVLNCDDQMIDILLEKGADILQVDSTGNTVIHAIVMYSNYFQDKYTNLKKPHFKQAIYFLLKAIQKRFKPKTEDTNSTIDQPIDFIRKQSLQYAKKRLRTLMTIKNVNRCTPLQLACKKGMKDVFEYLIEFENVNKFKVDTWGVDDTFCFDITELDTVHWREQLFDDERDKNQDMRRRPKGTEVDEEECQDCCKSCRKLRNIYKRPSALQEISNLPFRKGAEFMSVDIVDEVVRKKWETYRGWFWGFCLWHIIVVALLTVDSVVKIDTLNLKSETLPKNLDTRSLIFNCLNIVFSLMYVLQEIVRTFHFQQPVLVNPHNIICRFIFFAFGLALLVDLIWNFVQPNNYCRYLALFFGYFGLIFFLRTMNFFSYHTVVFLEIITGDIIKFVPIMAIIITPFTVAAYESFGTNTPGFDSYAESVLTFFQWMNGLGEISSVQGQLKPGLSIMVFVLYIIVANIILLQTLIALMSNNHISDVNRRYLLRLQRLSVVMFFESIFPNYCLKGVGEKVPFLDFSGEEQKRYQLLVIRDKAQETVDVDVNKVSLDNLRKLLIKRKPRKKDRICHANCNGEQATLLIDESVDREWRVARENLTHCH